MAPGSNVHVNELLCFVTNALHSIPFDVIVSACVNFYSDKDIVLAKDMVFDLVKHPTKRKKLRKASTVGKETANVNDILELLQLCDAEKILVPKFAALDIFQLPRLPLNQGDVNSICRELSQLKESVQSVLQFSNRRGANPNMPARQPTNGVLEKRTPSQQILANQTIESGSVHTPCISSGGSSDLGGSEVTYAKVAAAGLVGNGGDLCDSEGFRTVVYRKPRQRPGNKRAGVRPKAGIIGTGLNGTDHPPLKAGQVVRSFYVGRCGEGTTVEDIQRYVEAVFPDAKIVSVDLLTNPHAPHNCAFKIAIEDIAGDSLLDAGKWPVGVICRKYYARRGTGPPRTANEDDATPSH